MTLYDDLGVSPDATTEEIAAAGKKLQKQHHPDKGGDAEKFTKVTQALTILRDPRKRAQYDATGEEEAVSEELRQHQGAMFLISQQVANILGTGVDITRTNVISHIRRCLQEEMAKWQQKANQFDKARDKAAEFEKRLVKKAKKKGADLGPMASIIKSYRRQIEENRQKEGVDEALATHVVALEMLEDYDWTVDAAAPAYPSPTMGILTGQRGGWFDLSN